MRRSARPVDRGSTDELLMVFRCDRQQGFRRNAVPERRRASAATRGRPPPLRMWRCRRRFASSLLDATAGPMLMEGCGAKPSWVRGSPVEVQDASRPDSNAANMTRAIPLGWRTPSGFNAVPLGGGASPGPCLPGRLQMQNMARLPVGLTEARKFRNGSAGDVTAFTSLTQGTWGWRWSQIVILSNCCVTALASNPHANILARGIAKHRRAVAGTVVRARGSRPAPRST